MRIIQPSILRRLKHVGVGTLAILASSNLNLLSAAEKPAPSVPKVAPPPASADESPKDLFERICSACHTLSLPTSQRLNRANWEWVVTDMVSLYGCNFMNAEQQTKIIDYLTETYSPTKPR